MFVLVEKRRHIGPAPKPRAVLADLPTSAVSSTVSQRGLEFVLGLAGANVFGRKEVGKVLANDFIRMIAEDAFRPSIPTEHMSFQSDKEDGVLFRIHRQQLKALTHFL